MSKKPAPAVAFTERDGEVTVLLSDGSIWVYTHQAERPWNQYAPPIPRPTPNPFAGLRDQQQKPEGAP